MSMMTEMPLETLCTAIPFEGGQICWGHFHSHHLAGRMPPPCPVLLHHPAEGSHLPLFTTSMCRVCARKTLCICYLFHKSNCSQMVIFIYFMKYVRRWELVLQYGKLPFSPILDRTLLPRCIPKILTEMWWYFLSEIMPSYMMDPVERITFSRSKASQ